MRIAGRQKGAKVKPYTHIVVNPNAPKSRYTFSMHSSEAGAKTAAKKYSPLVGDDLKVVKQSGKSPSTDMFEATKRIPRKKDNRQDLINTVIYTQMKTRKEQYMVSNLQQSKMRKRRSQKLKTQVKLMPTKFKLPSPWSKELELWERPDLPRFIEST